MNISLSFGECLTMLLDKFSISGSKLSRALNVDPSLVNKWMHNKRVVPHNSNYIEQIADYICKCVPSYILEEAVSDMIEMFKLKIGRYEKQRCCKAIVELLSSTQDVVNMVREGDGNLNLSNTAFLESADLVGTGSTRLKARIAKSSLSGMCTAIEGLDNIMDTASLLLSETLQKFQSGPGTIMATNFTDLDIVSQYKGYRTDFYNLLMELFKRDWGMVRLYRLNNNLTRNTGILTEINCMLKSDKFIPYYFNSFGTSTDVGEMLIIPGVGALWGFSSSLGPTIDKALLIRNNEALKFLDLWFNSLLMNASPFIERSACSDIEDALKLGMEYGERFSNRYSISCLPYIFTIPYDILMKYTISDNHKDRAKQYLEINMDNFYNEISHFNFYCICSKHALEHLIAYGEYIYNDIRSRIETEDIIAYLENLMYIMETYDNFHIVFLNSRQFEAIPEVSISIRENDCVRINYGYMDKGREKVHTYKINEPTIVDAYRSYFRSIWNNLPQVKRDKEIMISWMKSQIRMLKVSSKEVIVLAK